MIRFIKIYEKRKITKGCVNFIQVVNQKNLTLKEFDDLIDYFEEVGYNPEDETFFDNSTNYVIINSNEQLENCPLPDGTIIYTSEFREYGEYIVTIGGTEREEDEIHIVLPVRL